MDLIAEKLNPIIAEDPTQASFYSFTGDLGKMSWEASTRYAACIGATTWDIEGIMGDRGATMGMTMCFGSGRGAHDSRDYLNSKLLIVWGRNVADTHTSELRDYVAAKKAGCKIIVIDPREFNRDGKPSLDLQQFAAEQGVDDLLVINYPYMINSKSYVHWLERLVGMDQ